MLHNITNAFAYALGLNVRFHHCRDLISVIHVLFVASTVPLRQLLRALFELRGIAANFLGIANSFLFHVANLHTYIFTPSLS